jgi:predicted ATPase
MSSWVLWFLGYPDQALKKSQEAIALARDLSHPFSLTYALSCSPLLYQLRREARLAQEQAERAIAFSTEQRIPVFLETVTQLRTWALTEQGHQEEIGQKERERITGRVIRAKMYRSYLLALLVEACGKRGQVEEGLAVLAEALAWVAKTGERVWEAELYRLKGTLTLQSQASLRQVSGKSQASQDKSEDTDPRPLASDPQAEAEACFHKAIEIARRQQAKSLELRAVMSLSRLWQQQGKTEEARQMMAEIYGWFTEGFDTKDLQEAKALLQELA